MARSSSSGGSSSNSRSSILIVFFATSFLFLLLDVNVNVNVHNVYTDAFSVKYKYPSASKSSLSSLTEKSLNRLSNRHSTASATATATATATVTLATRVTSLHVIPEPGPCPECSDVNGYWDGSVNFVCFACGHEWPVDSATADADADSDAEIVRDCNGNILESGDTVVLTKELGKGLKKGLKITRIRVGGDYGDGHDVEANIPQLGTFALKSQFLKKTK